MVTSHLAVNSPALLLHFKSESTDHIHRKNKTAVPIYLCVYQSTCASFYKRIYDLQDQPN